MVAECKLVSMNLTVITWTSPCTLQAKEAKCSANLVIITQNTRVFPWTTCYNPDFFLRTCQPSSFWEADINFNHSIVHISKLQICGQVVWWSPCLQGTQHKAVVTNSQSGSTGRVAKASPELSQKLVYEGAGCAGAQLGQSLKILLTCRTMLSEAWVTFSIVTIEMVTFLASISA